MGSPTEWVLFHKDEGEISEKKLAGGLDDNMCDGHGYVPCNVKS